MDLNLTELDKELLNSNPQLEVLYRKQNKHGIAVLVLVLLCVILFFLYFIVSQSIFFGLIFIIIPFAFFILKVLSATNSNFNEEYDKQKATYIQRLLDNLDSSELKFVSSNSDLNEQGIRELGFLRQDIDPALKYVTKNLIAGTYKEHPLKICELCLETKEGWVERSFLAWHPSTLIVLDNVKSNQQGRTSAYQRKSLYYSKSRGSDESRLPIIENMKHFVKLDGTVVKTGVKRLDEKYLILNYLNYRKSIESCFSNYLIALDEIAHYADGRQTSHSVFFLTQHEDRIVIVIFNQPFLKQRMEKIFEAYDEEIKSILGHLDIFVDQITNY